MFQFLILPASRLEACNEFSEVRFSLPLDLTSQRPKPSSFMPPLQRIRFQETSASATDFLHELNDPDLLRNRWVSPKAAIELRKQQVTKLRENIVTLSSKRDEFNRKMEEYIHNLEALIHSIEKTISLDSSRLGDSKSAAAGQATLVRCLTCDTQAVFKELQIIFARESDESLSLPTEVYVLDSGVLKKGHFQCGSCGTESLVIRAC